MSQIPLLLIAAAFCGNTCAQQPLWPPDLAVGHRSAAGHTQIDDRKSAMFVPFQKFTIQFAAEFDGTLEITSFLGPVARQTSMPMVAGEVCFASVTIPYTCLKRGYIVAAFVPSEGDSVDQQSLVGWLRKSALAFPPRRSIVTSRRTRIGNVPIQAWSFLHGDYLIGDKSQADDDVRRFYGMSRYASGQLLFRAGEYRLASEAFDEAIRSWADSDQDSQRFADLSYFAIISAASAQARLGNLDACRRKLMLAQLWQHRVSQRALDLSATLRDSVEPMILMREARHTEAIPLLQSILTRATGSDPEMVAATETGLGISRLELGDIAGLENLDRAFAMARHGPDPVQTVTLAVTRAKWRQRLGASPIEGVFAELSAVQDRVEACPLTVQADFWLASASLTADLPDLQREHLRRLESICKRIPATNNKLRVALDAYLVDAAFGRALLREFRHVVDEHLDSTVEDCTNAVRTATVVELLCALGELDQAEKTFKKGTLSGLPLSWLCAFARLSSRVRRDGHAELARHLLNPTPHSTRRLGMASIDQLIENGIDRGEGATPLHDLGPSIPLTRRITSARLWAEACLGVGDEAGAREALDAMTALAAAWFRSLRATHSERGLLLAQGKLQNELSAWLSATRGRPEGEWDVWRTTARLQGHVWDAVAHRPPDDAPGRMGAWLKELRDARMQLAESVASENSPDAARAAADRKEAVERRIARQAAPVPATAQAPAAAPRPARNEVLVQFIRYGELSRFAHPRYCALVVPHTGAVRRVELGPAPTITNAVGRWRAQITQGVDDRTAALAAGRLLWEPLRPHLPAEARTILIRTAEGLHSVPWPAMVAPKNRRRLLRDWTLVLSMGPPRGQRLASAHTSPPQGPAVLVGAIDYAKPSPESGTGQPGSDRMWSPLAGTAEEVRRIAALCPGPVQLLQANEATPQRVLQSMRSADVVHIASHGWFAAPDVRSGLKPPTWSETTRYAGPWDAGEIGGRHPLTLCGLVLSQGKRSRVLSAEMIAASTPPRIPLVVLSACDSGLGNAGGGEGVLGLHRAFHLSGADCVIGSLWKVDDRGALALMTGFYEKLWRQQLSPAEALRAAQLRMLGDVPLGTPSKTRRGPGAVVVAPQPAPAGFRTADWAAFMLSRHTQESQR